MESGNAVPSTRAVKITRALALGSLLAFVFIPVGAIGLAYGVFAVSGVLGMVANNVATTRRLTENVSAEEWQAGAQAVANSFSRVGVATPQVQVWGVDVANAGAARIGRSGSVILTRGALKHPEHLDAILSHEIGHYKHADSRVLVGLGLARKALGLVRGWFMFAPVWAATIAVGGFFSLHGLWAAPVAAFAAATSMPWLALAGATLAAKAVSMHILRRLETRADRECVENGGDPLMLADALRTIERENESSPTGALMRLLRVNLPGGEFPYKKPTIFHKAAAALLLNHPHTAKRIEALEAMAAATCPAPYPAGVSVIDPATGVEVKEIAAPRTTQEPVAASIDGASQSSPVESVRQTAVVRSIRPDMRRIASPFKRVVPRIQVPKPAPQRHLSSAGLE